ncbi:uncharacterized protein N7469_006804 [Penicillium citrinum]|uniref:Uncharacterized protein n=1 Tax=Penicillium citrinum TaxID=5077 RepID=A0A9W9NVH5_PENCI|nr:uncharacterized protein N7469_006804 [Penicillium citrinum]KAJ5226798.1 hypothetical protein N7469_006804 [Penicillium citrinum]KAK5791094.1 hypothetical protein VI817_006403 [Penicillium citrinum]
MTVRDAGRRSLVRTAVDCQCIEGRGSIQNKRPPESRFDFCGTDRRLDIVLAVVAADIRIVQVFKVDLARLAIKLYA